jgi:hypothetical protein
MEKNLRYSALLSIYGALLTDKQSETMEYYYDEDLSLGEIAENTGISRQGVRDFIKRGEEALDTFEEKLGLYEKSRIYSEIEEAANEIKKINAERVSNKNIDILADSIIENVRRTGR